MLEIRGIWLCHMSRWDRYVLHPRVWAETSGSETVPHSGPYNYRYKDTTSHTVDIQVPEYNTSAEDTCLGTDYNHMPSGKGKTHHAHVHMGPGSPPGTPS